VKLLLPSIAIALAVAALGFGIPLALRALAERHDPETEAGWPGESINFSDAIPQANAIAIVRLPSKWHDEWKLADDGRYQKLDVTVKWYVKGELAHPSPSWVMTRHANGTPTTLPATGLDRIVFFRTDSASDLPIVFKIAQVGPQRMTELRDRIGPWRLTTQPSTQPSGQPATQTPAP
jgi:hypothetical protein